MAKILFLHGLAGCPGGQRVAALCERGPDVYAPAFPFSEAKIAGLTLRLVEQWRRDGCVADPFPRWTAQAQKAYDEFDPDLVVGIDLGAALTMRINSGDTALVLVAPPWTGRVNVRAVVDQIAPPRLRGTREWLGPRLRYPTVALVTPPAIKAP